MNKIALLFPGQGAQYPGMGKPLYETEREIFDMAEKFRPGITKICFEGTPDDLKKTENTQPCLVSRRACRQRIRSFAPA